MRITSVRFAPLLLLHLRHCALIFLTARLLLTAAMALARQPLLGAEYVVLMPLLAGALLHVDLRRASAPDLYANLGYGTRELVGMGMLTAVSGELIIEFTAALA